MRRAVNVVNVVNIVRRRTTFLKVTRLCAAADELKSPDFFAL